MKNFSSKSVLPQKTDEAIRRMTELTGRMKVLAEREETALAEQSVDELKIVIAQKQDMSSIYEKAQKEFRARLDEFKTSDPELLRELDREHEALAILTAKNSTAYNRMINAKN